jgi:hypothetical protein
VLTAETTLTTLRIDEAISRSLACLKNSFRTTEDGAAGWYHYLDDTHPGVTASAVGLYCFHLAGIPFERSDEVIKYLIAEQVRRPEGSGGWSVRTTSGVPIVEATAWVVRALSTVGSGRGPCWQALEAGAQWLADNQNTDFGWGSYKGQPSRVFTTVLAMLALEECGGFADTLANAQKWLNDAQSPGRAAWGALPGGEPTMLHTSFCLMALRGLRGAMTPNSVKQTCDWLADKLEADQFTEKSTIVEEYDVPYMHGDVLDTFQNSLPHFAGPVTITALICAGADPFHPEIFSATESILQSQICEGSSRIGTWELPRSPLRPSVWAIWPFLAALSSVRAAVFPPTDSRATLLFPGCAIIQTSGSTQRVTLRLLVRNAGIDWMRRHRLAMGLWSVALVMAGIAVFLWIATPYLTLATFLATLVVPILLLVFQILLERTRHKVG